MQSALCKIGALCRAQWGTKAGGWWPSRERKDTAVNRACTALLNMGPHHICSGPAAASAKSAAQWEPSANPLLWLSRPFLAKILNISLGPLRPLPFFRSIMKRRTALYPEIHSSEGQQKTPPNLFEFWCSPVGPQTCQCLSFKLWRKGLNLLLSLSCVHIVHSYWEYIYGWSSVRKIFAIWVLFIIICA